MNNVIADLIRRANIINCEKTLILWSFNFRVIGLPLYLRNIKNFNEKVFLLSLFYRMKGELLGEAN
ncbi:hypothetical protein B9T28_09600 [Acinetobacter silvestris]|uniref:Uncharacterized protein n=1 Tax=Acinetobacter silvestris TaxID=1977882 RepID=A0A1Y3CIS1_9GAMM|nr:hypothetical protein B9T28_09600 [Acinetobacter silvestris]